MGRGGLLIMTYKYAIVGIDLNLPVEGSLGLPSVIGRAQNLRRDFVEVKVIENTPLGKPRVVEDFGLSARKSKRKKR